MDEEGSGLLTMFFELACFMSLEDDRKLFPLEPKAYGFAELYFGAGLLFTKAYFSGFLLAF